MLEIFELSDRLELFDETVDFFWREWGSNENYTFYQDCMFHSCNTDSDLPRFYIAVKNHSIIGSFAILRNDLISRQDLTPWLACLFVVPEERGEQLGSILLQQALQETYKKGYRKLYLCTDLEEYYEKYGWTHMGQAYIFNGESTKMYYKSTEKLVHNKK